MTTLEVYYLIYEPESEAFLLAIVSRQRASNTNETEHQSILTSEMAWLKRMYPVQKYQIKGTMEDMPYGDSLYSISDGDLLSLWWAPHPLNPEFCLLGDGNISDWQQEAQEHGYHHLTPQRIQVRIEDHRTI